MVVGTLEHVYTFLYHKLRDTFLLGEDLLAPAEGLGSRQSVAG